MFEIPVEVIKHIRKTLDTSGFSLMELIILIAAIVITIIVAITEFRSYQMRPNHPPNTPNTPIPIFLDKSLSPLLLLAICKMVVLWIDRNFPSYVIKKIGASRQGSYLKPCQGFMPPLA